MQAATNFLTEPGVIGVASVILGFATKGFFDERTERRRQKYEAAQQKEQRTHEAEQQKEQRIHEAEQQQEEAYERRVQAYAHFLGTAHTVGNQFRLAKATTKEDMRALSQSYAQVDVVATTKLVRDEAYSIFQSALEGNEEIIDTDGFIDAIREEERKEKEEG